MLETAIHTACSALVKLANHVRRFVHLHASANLQPHPTHPNQPPERDNQTSEANFRRGESTSDSRGDIRHIFGGVAHCDHAGVLRGCELLLDSFLNPGRPGGPTGAALQHNIPIHDLRSHHPS